MHAIVSSVRELRDDQLTGRLYELRGRERRLQVEFLVHLGELDRRQLCLALGFPSLFAYCTDHLGLSKASAFRRTSAARLLVRFPVLAGYLDDGRLNLTTLVELRDVLHEERLDEVLARASGRSEEQVKQLVATLRPRPAPAEMLRRLPAAKPQPSSDETSAARSPFAESVTSAAPSPGTVPVTSAAPSPDTVPVTSAAPSPGTVAVTSAAPSPGTVPVTSAAPSPGTVPVTSAAPSPGTVPVTSAAQQARRARLEPINAQLQVLRVTVDEAFVADLRAVCDLLSHQVPDGRLDQILHHALRVTREQAERRRRGSGRAAEATTTSGRYIPASVRDEVWRRDGGRCTFVGTTGHRCDSSRQLELHHIIPFARGGTATVGNLTLHCRAHNAHEAIQDFGPTHVALSIAERQACLF